MNKMNKDITSYYDAIADGYDELHFEEQKKKFDILKKNMHLSSNANVLDVGCGTFFSEDYFKWNLYGIEPSAEMVKLFIKAHPDKKDKIKVGFAEELSKNYEKSFFDALICVSVAHHFENPKLAFEEMKKVCKPAALFGITLLKNTKKFAELENEIKNFFNVVKRIDSDFSKDVVFICKIK
jgi:ubiquinone/menaquinone biosynthesis C-methylase UbiE